MSGDHYDEQELAHRYEEICSMIEAIMLANPPNTVVVDIRRIEAKLDNGELSQEDIDRLSDYYRRACN